MKMMRQHLISGDLSSAFQFTITKDNYKMSHKKVILFTIPANRPKMAVDAPTEISSESKALNKLPPTL